MSVSAGAGVSIGLAAVTEADQELRDSFAGGENFVARVALLSARKRAAEEAEASLQLGRDAVAALEDARQKQAAADQNLRDAAGARAIAAQTKESADSYAAKRKAEADVLMQRAEER